MAKIITLVDSKGNPLNLENGSSVGVYQINNSIEEIENFGEDFLEVADKYLISVIIKHTQGYYQSPFHDFSENTGGWLNFVFPIMDIVNSALGFGGCYIGWRESGAFIDASTTLDANGNPKENWNFTTDGEETSYESYYEIEQLILLPKAR